jgi:hypothetical protein
MSQVNLGSLTSTPKLGSLHELTIAESTDVFQFSVGSSSSKINLGLKNISYGDDADLSLYRDSNNNGVLDSSDQLIKSSSYSSNHDEAINVQAPAAGTYFAQVSRYAGGSSGNVSYDLFLSSTPVSQPGNLLSHEIEVGNMSGTYPFPKVRTFSDRVDSTDTSDVYHFSVERSGLFIASLDGLINDADIRLIQDSNRNGVVDQGEVLGTSNNDGITSEIFSAILQPGDDYYVQVYQYSGDTTYNLSMLTS